MLFTPCLLALGLAAAEVRAIESTLSFTNSISTLTSVSSSVFTGSEFTYLTNSGQSTVTTAVSVLVTSNSSATASGQKTVTSSSQSLTQLVGGAQTSSASNGTASRSSTSSAAVPTNTTPCNGYPELCDRKYSNITQVVSHNSAFAIKNNAASNQVLGIIDQLNDGIRMIQGETHKVNGTIYACHTSCDLLNAGPYEDELAKVANWVRDHPYDVVSILIGNSDFADNVTALDYVDAIQNSGLGPYLYEPAYVPQRKDQWPTLSEMILSGKRVVIFIDYNANQTAVPYILDEYSHMWSTPFSPTDPNFPCTLQLPPNLNETLARDEYMYLANHNLNTEVSIAGFSLLIPNTANVSMTNGQENVTGQLEAMRLNCTTDWGRPPNFLVVDYYNYGYPEPGSVFEVAARANNVTWNGKLASSGNTSAASSTARLSAVSLLAAVLVGFLWAL